MTQPNMTTSRFNLQRFIVAQQPLYAWVGRTQGWPQADTVDIPGEVWNGYEQKLESTYADSDLLIPIARSTSSASRLRCS